MDHASIQRPPSWISGRLRMERIPNLLAKGRGILDEEVHNYIVIHIDTIFADISMKKSDVNDIPNFYILLEKTNLAISCSLILTYFLEIWEKGKS